ncbi:hypothetical protein [Micrococcus sp. KBS0714]|uniref:hypothetical protein n=1 Tax=Micrococcus sp. KBS0714 TaxID=1179670 RepID=UPI001188DF84|nr:hypothetical protein [Micrococcus sp. KBS0714]QDW16642.1 hypothetical protein B1A86_00001385 [Micrococcus sp. KBS0714]
MQDASSESRAALERLRAASAPRPDDAETRAPAARPRRALAAPGEISRRDLRRHERALRSGRSETAAERRVREDHRADVHRAMDRLRTPGAPAEQRPRRDLSEILDRLGSPDLARFADPLVGTVERILPAPGRDPEKAAEAARRRTAAEERRRARLRAGRAAEHERPVAEAAAAAQARDAARARDAAALQARLDEEARRAQAARVARRRREEEKQRRRREAERRRRVAAEEKARAAAEAEARRREREERRRREAEVAAERARVQAERRAREEAALAERERLRLEAEAEAERRRQAAEAERRRLEAERVEAERRRRAEEAERRRREAEEAARLEAERRRRQAARVRAHTVLHAERALAQARLLEDRAREAERRAAEDAARRRREHEERESRALARAARELEGPEVFPAAADRPLLSDPEERLTDEELFARARVALPEWRRRQRLSTKAQAVRAEATAHSSAGPVTGALPLIPGYTPAPPEEPAGSPTAADRRGQALLTVVWALFVLSGAWGLGLAGRVPGLGALDAGAYPLTADGRHGPGASVFGLSPLHPAIWPVLWLLTGMYVLRQWGRGQGASPRHRRIRGAIAGALLALALWFPLAVLAPGGFDVVPWLLALVLMLRVVRRLGARPAARRVARVAEDGALGVLLGTLLAGAPTAVGAALHAWGVHVGWFPTELLALLVLVALLLAALRLVLGGRGRMGVALGMAWTLLCLALPRLLPSPLGAQQSVWVGLAAAFGALLLVTAAAVRRSWARQIERDAARRPHPAGA